MKITSLKINSEIEYSGLKFIIHALNPPNITIFQKDGKTDPIIINYYDLITNDSFIPSNHILNTIEKDNESYYSILDTLNENKREKVSKRFLIIRPLLVFEKLKSGDFTAYVEFIKNYKHLLDENDNVERLNQEQLLTKLEYHFEISKRTIQRYLSNYKKMDEIKPNKGEEGLIPKGGEGYKYRTDNKVIQLCHPNKPDFIIHTLHTRLDEKYVSIIKSVIEKEYLNTHKISKRKIYDLIAIQCLKMKLKIPKEITIYKLLDRIPSKIVERMRYGTKAGQKYEDVIRGYANEEALFPLHVVEIDHTQLDIDVLDEKGNVTGRPWITLGIDLYTRMVWCLHISFEPPSANKVRKAIQQGVLFKGTKEKYNTLKEWDLFGIPQSIVFDNGTEFNNAEVKRIVDEVLKSNIRFRPIATPRYGGTIERFFRTINMKLIHQLKGTRKSNVQDLGEYDAESNALLTLEDITEILTRYITDVYHFEEHRGLPLESNTPIVRYYEGLQLSGYPEFVPEDETEVFKIELLPTVLKPYTRDGVRLDNRLYRKSDLSLLINKREIKYKVKYDIDDISYIYIQLPESSEYVKVFCYSPSADVLKGINQYTYKLLLNSLAEEGRIKRNKIVSEEDLLYAKAALQEVINKKYKRNRGVRQQAKRMNLDIDVKIPTTINISTKEEASIDLLLEEAMKAYEDQLMNE
ncbi:DDE-type integrase/transposase/recombinase [Fictibacillus nanhaiensis]|uniref:Mu transposase C-terminal domain-containing protein n=1 Tax=Fictibacillus nanhaiensis TaxID=742169 RepID=UPI001C944341|nr:DDE-type integrase/transposase/recombinase [Fictibacillus nanhaiensis]